MADDPRPDESAGPVAPVPASPADHRYVACTTFRRTGERVTSPVWIAELGDGTVGFTTGGDSGKVKRLRRDPRMELTPCDVRGNVPAGAPTWTGTARVVDLDEQPWVRAAIVRRYGWQMRLVGWTERFRRRGAERPVGVVVALDDR